MADVLSQDEINQMLDKIDIEAGKKPAKRLDAMNIPAKVGSLSRDQINQMLSTIDAQKEASQGDNSLSQDTVDHLLAQVDSTKKEPQDSGTESRPDKFSREQLGAIQAIHEKFALLASKSLSLRLRSNVKMSVASLDQLYMEEFFRVIPIPSSLGIISILNGGAVLQIDNDIKVAIINKMCDNNDELIGQSHESGGIGGKIMEYIYSLLLENLREAWSDVTDLLPKLEKIEHEPQFIKIAPPKEWVLVVTFETKIEDPAMKPLSAQGMMNLCIPYPVLEPVRTNW